MAVIREKGQQKVIKDAFQILQLPSRLWSPKQVLKCVSRIFKLGQTRNKAPFSEIIVTINY